MSADPASPDTHTLDRIDAAGIVAGLAAMASATRVAFKTRLMGYNRPGELCDPLIHGETIGTRIGQAAC